MILKYWIILLLFVTGVFSIKETNISTTEDDNISSGNDDTSSQSENNNNDADWLPHINVTCKNEKLLLLDNPMCVDGKITQIQKVCSASVYKDQSSTDRGCVTSQRVVNCTEEKVCNSWSSWKKDCCNNDTCEINGITLNYGAIFWNRTRNCREDIDTGCTSEYRVQGRKQGPGYENAGILETSGAGSSVRTIAFALSGTVMVGLLLFAGLRLRNAAIRRRRATPYDRTVQGVDNEVGPLSPDSRIHTILNKMNTNGRSYELRERSDSTASRRIYVLSPTPQDPSAGRGRVFSRATSQLSSIAEEDADDALSHITEGSEPPEDDNVFRYDSDAINEVDNLSSSAFSTDDMVKTASSSEALNCINDVIAMYDVDNDVDNDNFEEILRQNSKSSNTDFSISEDHEKDNYLQNFGWKPQERAWKLEKLKDDNSKSKERLFASCSTLDSQFSTKSLQSSMASMNSDLEALDMSETNLRKEYKSLPSLLDTSQIPDIEEVLFDNNADTQEYCDVIENGCVNV